jgi:hypothetical protein
MLKYNIIMSQTNNFEQQLQQWVTVDNQIKVLNDKLKELRDKKTALNTNITNYAEKNNLMNTAMRFGDEKIKFSTSKVQQPVTLTYLEKCLKDVIKNESQATQIFEYIKNNRETKINSEIKRFTNN